MTYQPPWMSPTAFNRKQAWLRRCERERKDFVKKCTNRAGNGRGCVDSGKAGVERVDTARRNPGPNGGLMGQTGAAA